MKVTPVIQSYNSNQTSFKANIHDQTTFLCRMAKELPHGSFNLSIALRSSSELPRITGPKNTAVDTFLAIQPKTQEGKIPIKILVTDTETNQLTATRVIEIERSMSERKIADNIIKSIKKTAKQIFKKDDCLD